MISKFFTTDQKTIDQYYHVPKSFIYKDSEYFKMSPMSKLLYALLVDRQKLSLQHGWIDSENRIYLEFRQAEMCELMGISHPKTLRKYLNELADSGLLYRERMGLTEPDHLYLLKDNYQYIL